MNTVSARGSLGVPVQEAEYKALVKAQEAAIAALTEGAPMGAAQTAAIEALKVVSVLSVETLSLRFSPLLRRTEHSGCARVCVCLPTTLWDAG